MWAGFKEKPPLSREFIYSLETKGGGQDRIWMYFWDPNDDSSLLETSKWLLKLFRWKLKFICTDKCTHNNKVRVEHTCPKIHALRLNPELYGW